MKFQKMAGRTGAMVGAASLALLLILSSCTDEIGGLADLDPPDVDSPGTTDPGADVQRVLCRVDVRAGTFACARPPGLGDLASQLLVGSQNKYVTLESPLVGYDVVTEIFFADVTVQNLMPQPLGTEDGETLHADGVRVFFHDGPHVTQGTGVVTVANATGTGNFTAPDQPFFRYDEILEQDDTSDIERWEWNVPDGVDLFEFSVAVSAAVPHEDGWVEATHDSASVRLTETLQLDATVFSAVGEVEGDVVAWSSGDEDIATVDQNGLVTVHDVGWVTITAATGNRTPAEVEIFGYVQPDWLVVGENGGAIYASEDGSETWSFRSSPLAHGRGVAYGDGLWVVVGRTGTGNFTNTLITSPDAVNWTARTTPFANIARGVAWNGSMWMATALTDDFGCNTHTVTTSADGITWSAGTTPLCAVNQALWDGDRWFVVGTFGPPVTGPQSDWRATFAFSEDGSNWTYVQDSPFGAGNGLDTQIRRVAYNGSMYVMVGENPPGVVLATSEDGENWTAFTGGDEEDLPFAVGRGIAWNGSIWVAVGSGGTHAVATSSDGETWTPVNDVGFDFAENVVWDGSIFLATLRNHDDPIATSPDGVNWTPRSSALSDGYGAAPGN